MQVNKNERLWIDDHPVICALCYGACLFTIVVNGFVLLADLGVI